MADLTHLNNLVADQWYTDETLGVWSKRALQQMRSDGVGPPYVRVQNRVLYRGGAVLEWLRSLEGKEA